MPLGLVTRIFAICCCASSLAAVLAGCQNFLPPGEGDSPLGPLSDSSRVPETDPPRDAAWADQSSVVQILQNGRIVENPAYPYRGNKYLFEFISGDNDLPWLRQYAINHKIFAGVNMSLEWKDREWDMIKAIIYYTSHTLPFSGVNTDPDNSLLFRARMILTTAMSHPEYYWGCGSISQTAVGLAQAHGIPARMINGRTLEDPCTGDYCCEMFSTRWNRWIFLMPHVYAWIEHDTDGPLGVAQLHQYDLEGQIRSNLIPQQDQQVLDDDGNWITITIPQHFEAIPNPPLVFMPTINNLAPIAPFMTINWWSGYFHRVALSYTTMTQQEYPIMAEVFNDDFLNHTPCFSHDPIPVVSAGDPDITQPMNNVEASAEIEEEGIRVHLLTNMVDLEGFQMLGPDDQWQAIKAEPAGPARFDLLWRPESLGVLTLQGINTAGVTSPKIVIQLSTMEVGL